MAQDSEAFGDELARFRHYLVLLAEMNLPPALRAKISSSDLVQDTLLQAHQHLDQFRGKTDAELAAWLRRILIRQMLDTLRKFRTQARNFGKERSLEAVVEASSQHLERVLATEEMSPSRVAEYEEEVVGMTRALSLLPEDQRIVVAMKHLQSRSVAEICAKLGKSEAAVAGLLRRGLQRLRELMDTPE